MRRPPNGNSGKGHACCGNHPRFENLTRIPLPNGGPGEDLLRGEPSGGCFHFNAARCTVDNFISSSSASCATRSYLQLATDFKRNDHSPTRMEFSRLEFNDSPSRWAPNCDWYLHCSFS